VHRSPSKHGTDRPPRRLREKIRASGLTFDAIAADAVRYA